VTPSARLSASSLRDAPRRATPMAKRPLPGRCVHCLRDPVERDWDHVFPDSWYPDSSPENQQKWQVPSCVPCNTALGKIEDDLLRRIGLCLDPLVPASTGIVEKALRAHTPEAGKDERDRRVRAALRKRVLDEAVQAASFPKEVVYPGMGDRWGGPPEDRLALLIPADGFHRLTEKIVRGIYYVMDNGKFIEPPFAVESFPLHPANSEQIRDILAKFGITYAREPGIMVRRAVTDDGTSSLLEIELWGQVKIYAAVTRP
jgi:hypothetical protein